MKAMKCSHRIFSTTCLASLLPLLAILAASSPPQSAIGEIIRESQAGSVLQVEATPAISAGVPSSFTISFAELGYDEKTLADSYEAIEYTLPLPETWQVREGSYLDLDVSYVHDDMSPLVTVPPGSAAVQGEAGQAAIISGTQSLPAHLSDIIVAVDGQVQFVFPITAAVLEHRHLNVPLPLSILNDPARSAHIVRVSLDASLTCNIPLKPRLTIHPSSSFLLLYNHLPVTPDLATYPRPFYHYDFGTDQVAFVLPDNPTATELAGAMAVAAKLGNTTSRMVISGTTDLELMSRIGADEPPRQHLFVIGTPEDNQVVSELSRLKVLPISLQERQLSLASQGPAAVVSGGDLTYTLVITNTSQEAVTSLSLVDVLPAQAQVVSCSPVCSQTTREEVSWPLPSLKVGESVSYTLKLNLSQGPDTTVENTLTLLNATSNPINVSTLTATVSAVPQSVSGLTSRISDAAGYFFAQGERAVPESEGIVQEVVSPWDQTRAILVITGLTDEAVYKASRAMSAENRFPGMEGAIALVRELRPISEFSTEPPASDRTFAELGYGDRILQGVQDSTYYFNIPLGWSLTEKAYLELHFKHSQLIDYSRSSLNVLFNNEPIAGISFSEATALAGDLRIPIPTSVAHPGQRNKISIQAEMQPADNCANRNMLWLLISSASTLHLDHSQQDAPSLNLDFYPYPFNRQPDLTDVLFVLPPKPASQEWLASLQLAASLGRVADGNSFAPGVALAYAWPEDKSDYQLIAIGRPSRNLLLQQVNAQLPQPFLPGSDMIEQKLNDVILRLPPGVDLGYLQLIYSPWNEERALLAITGTSDKGIEWAIQSLIDYPQGVGGNLTMVRAGQIQKIDTRLLTHSGRDAAVSTAVPELTPVAVISASVLSGSAATPAASQPVPTSAPQGRPGVTWPAWLIPLVAAMLIAVLVIFAIAIVRARPSNT
jgi:uncharacterized repeat protein (TIGR01451 family)